MNSVRSNTFSIKYQGLHHQVIKIYELKFECVAKTRFLLYNLVQPTEIDNRQADRQKREMDTLYISIDQYKDVISKIDS